ncbi:MAG: thiolase family protein [Thermodesulfobacteriota bacterium]|nr:thiolase family protein [Thermodesulfobacteriota bacterium]
MRTVCIVGVGMTQFGRFKESNVIELGRTAALNAILDAGIDKKDIQVAYAGHARTGQLYNRECGVGQSILWDLGISGIPISSVGNFCSSGSTALRDTWLAIGTGMYDVAIAIGVEKLTGRAGKGRPLTSDGVELLTAMGFSPPVYFANVATRHMEEFGTTKEQLAMVAVKNRKNAGSNPRCQYRDPITIEEVLNSPSIVEPFTLLNCCPTTDGAAAAILCSKEVAKRYTSKPIEIGASALASGPYKKSKDITTFEADRCSAKEAYEISGIGPEDIDFAEVHDCFTIAEIVHYEDFGFCKKGEGGRFIEEGLSGINGKIPVSVSGGLLSRGHPIGATGLAQIAEAVWQLRGVAENQVKGAKVAFTHCAGGFQDTVELGDVQSSAVTILKRGW